MVTSKQRTISGAILALIMLPLFLGLLACLPVPIGDPERSRIDPDMTGIWVGFEKGVTFFEPYDKRTWLVTSVAIDAPKGCRPPGTADEYDKLVAWLEVEQCASAGEAVIFKAWRSKQGKHWFLTMQPMATVDEDAEDPFADDVWFVYRIEKSGADAFALRLIDPEFGEFEGLPQTRRAYEKVIRRHAANDDMYISDADPFVRVQNEHIGLFTDFVEELIDID